MDDANGQMGPAAVTSTPGIINNKLRSSTQLIWPVLYVTERRPLVVSLRPLPPPLYRTTAGNTSRTGHTDLWRRAASGLRLWAGPAYLL